MNTMTIRQISRNGVREIFSKVDEGGLEITNEPAGKKFLVERTDLDDSAITISDFRYNACKMLNSITAGEPLVVSRYNKGSSKVAVYDSYKITLVEG